MKIKFWEENYLKKMKYLYKNELPIGITKTFIPFLLANHTNLLFG